MFVLQFTLHNSQPLWDANGVDPFYSEFSLTVPAPLPHIFQEETVCSADHCPPKTLSALLGRLRWMATTLLKIFFIKTKVTSKNLGFFTATKACMSARDNFLWLFYVFDDSM
ncbi:hypothetical protein PoB_006467900 [Plakobranchus ocellatus]|uniref:Uncharacterized protein n=1 Tax=Plakobranchus ocellatus TaxID=259542 RepID=A0AAV4D1Y4_9GAST|nr:hypothetical protein PoB_006467900 [Plakobranchus ocellatus]